MASSIPQIRIRLINSLVAVAAAIGIVIDPTLWISVPGQISQTDYKLLLLNAMSDAFAFQEQLNDAFIVDVEKIVSISPPQTGVWMQNQMLNVFQFNSGTPQVPIIDASNPPVSLVPHFSPIVLGYQVIKYCAVIFASAGRVLIKVAGQVAGLPVNLDTVAGTGALAATQSYVNSIAAPGISYVVSSGISDWLFLQLDVYYQGVYSAVIFANVQSAITTFLNNLANLAFSNNSIALLKLSALEEAILAVAGVNDVEFINVAGRPDSNSLSPGSTTFGTSQQQFLVVNAAEILRSYQTQVGYIALENGTSTGGAVANSKLSDYRVGSSGLLNLNCIPQ